MLALLFRLTRYVFCAAALVLIYETGVEMFIAWYSGVTPPSAGQWAWAAGRIAVLVVAVTLLLRGRAD